MYISTKLQFSWYRIIKAKIFHFYDFKMETQIKKKQIKKHIWHT